MIFNDSTLNSRPELPSLSLSLLPPDLLILLHFLVTFLKVSLP